MIKVELDYDDNGRTGNDDNGGIDFITVELDYKVHRRTRL